MKRKTTLAAFTGLCLAAALAAPGAASAGNSPSRAFAQAVGIGETELREWMGWSPLTYRQLRQDPSRTSAKLLRALGRERHARLEAGQAIDVQVEVGGRPAVLQVQRGRPVE